MVQDSNGYDNDNDDDGALPPTAMNILSGKHVGYRHLPSQCLPTAHTQHAPYRGPCFKRLPGLLASITWTINTSVQSLLLDLHLHGTQPC
jgi:hypothetical protein